ncbi:MAG TPA: hypothetical protein V6D11_20320 [Waterburya sp.]|jgi:hypothetical protein
MKNIVSVIKDDLRNHTLVTYEDGSIEKIQRQKEGDESLWASPICPTPAECTHPGCGVSGKELGFVQNQEANKEIVCVVQDNEKEHI